MTSQEEKVTQKKFSIAREQLEKAIEIYFEETSLWSCLTLAGAAEEILGRLAEEKNKRSSMNELINAVQGYQKRKFGEADEYKDIKKRITLAKNHAKHHDPDKFSNYNEYVDSLLTLDIKEEAESAINRAIDNYWLCEVDLTELMYKFQNRHRQ